MSLLTPLKHILQRLLRSSIAKDAGIMSVGAAGSQLILFASIPVLARLYRPEDFGLMAVFIALSQILSIPATGRYERGLLTASTTNETGSLICGMAGLILIWFLVIEVCIAAGSWSSLELESVLLMLPVAAISVAVINVGEFCCTRDGFFKRVAITKMLLATSIVGVQIAMAGQAGPGKGLIVGYVAGQILIAFVHLCSILISQRSEIAAALRDPIGIIAVLRAYSGLPRYSLPAGLLNTIGRQSLILISAGFFSVVTVGYIEMANRVVRAPMNFVNQALEKVFVSRLGRNRREGRSNIPLLKKAVRALTVIALLAGVSACFLLEPVIIYVIGPQWDPAVVFGLLLLPAVFSNFITFPVSKMYLYGKEKTGLFWQVGYSSGNILMLLLGGLAGIPVLAVALFAIFSASMNILHLALTTKYAGGSLVGLFRRG
jgi:O-antigen/teichoic acid export membrane protein